MYKPTIKQLAGIILTGVGVVLVLVLGDFPLVGAGLAGIFTMLAEYQRVSRKSARRCTWAQS